MDNQLVRQKLKFLPVNLRDWLASENTAEQVGMLSDKFNIPKSQRKIIPRLILRLVLKDLDSGHFTGELSFELKIDRDRAKIISDELKKIVFSPAINDLKRLGIDIDLLDKFEVPISKLTTPPTHSETHPLSPKIIATNTTIQPIGSVRTEAKENPKINPPTLTPFQLRTNQSAPIPQTPSKIPMPNAVDLRGTTERIEVKNLNTLNLKNAAPVSTPKDQIQTPPLAPINPVKITPQPTSFEARREIPNAAALPIKPLASEPFKNPPQSFTPTATPTRPIEQEVNIFEQLKNLEKSGSELVNVLRTREEKAEQKSSTPTPIQNTPKSQSPVQNIPQTQTIEPKIPTPMAKPALGPVMIHQETKVAPITQRINQIDGAPRMPIQPTNQIGAISQNSGSLNLNKINNQNRDANPGWLKAIFGKPAENDGGPVKTVSFSEEEEVKNQPQKMTPPSTRPVMPELKQNTERPLTPQNPIKSTPLTKPNPSIIPQPTTMDIHQPGSLAKKNEPMIDLGAMKKIE